MITLLIATRTVVGDPIKDKDEAQAFVDRLDKDNLGWLLGRLRKLTNLDDEVAAMLEAAVDARNTLTHHFFARYPSGLDTPEGRNQVCQDIEECVAAIGKADEQVIGRIKMLREQMKKVGLARD